MLKCNLHFVPFLSAASAAAIPKATEMICRMTSRDKTDRMVLFLMAGCNLQSWLRVIVCKRPSKNDRYQHTMISFYQMHSREQGLAAAEDMGCYMALSAQARNSVTLRSGVSGGRS